MKTIHTQKLQLVAPESIIPGIPYAFTVNPKPDLEITMQESTVALLKQLADEDVWAKLQAEFSTKMRLHYHGIIRFTYDSILPAYTIFNKYENDFQIKIVPVDDFGWHVYCNKQRHIAEKFCKRKHLSYKLRTYKIPKGRFFVNLTEQFQAHT